jgi:hypothetical protein
MAFFEFLYFDFHLSDRRVLRVWAVSTYYSQNMTKSQIDLVTAFMSTRNISAYNTRLFALTEDGHTVLELRIACAAPRRVDETTTFEGQTIRVRLKLCVDICR